MRKLKKVFCFLSCGCAGVLLCSVLLLSCLSLIPFVPRDYTKKTATGGPIEAHYLAMGTHGVQSLSVAADEPSRKITCFYPEELPQDTCRWPVVVFVNGTGVMPAKYDTLFRHLASWGFIVIGNDDPGTWSGKSADMTLEWLLQEDVREDSIFHGRVDKERIGISGHSQGGVGVFNSISIQPHKGLYKTAVALSPTHEEGASAIRIPYDITKVAIPTLMISGTVSDFETKFVIPREKMLSMYSRLIAPKAMMRRRNCDHGQSLYSADGYVTAWFLWHLKDDEEAARAFTGNHPELLENKLYIDQKIDFSKKE